MAVNLDICLPVQMLYCGVNFEIAHSIVSTVPWSLSQVYECSSSGKAMATDVYTTAVWSLSVCVVNSIKTLVQVA